MAYKIIVTKKIEKSAAKVSQWLRNEWSIKSSNQFEKRLIETISEIILNPGIGRQSSKKNVRSLSVTKHNRLYYKISKTSIILLDLFETKQSPTRNKYE